MQMLLAGEWVDRKTTVPVTNPYDGREIGAVPRATPEDVERALQFASQGMAAMRGLPGYIRYQILMKAARLLEEQREDFAHTITLEEGKILAESRLEVSRAVETLTGSAEEAKRLGSEVVPLGGAPGAGNRFGFTIRIPCGVVVAITPFNFPLNLVSHKVGPALAAGNTVILKPASDTPLSALKFTRLLLEAGLPAEGIQCLTGPGGEIGNALASDSRVRKISFTGSREVGEHICRAAGLKKITMELGSNAPFIVLPDADLDRAAEAIVATGYANAGQVCISAQRVLAHEEIYAALLAGVRSRVETLTTGDPLNETTNVGPMIRESDAMRVADWVEEARAAGARLITGGERKASTYRPTVLADIHPDMRISRDELFGPAVGFASVPTIDKALALANDTRFGLSAAIFTENLENAMRFAREADSGNIHINWGPQWRADLMPYGGLKDSGFGKEGPKYAVEEMTETKMVVMHLR